MVKYYKYKKSNIQEVVDKSKKYFIYIHITSFIFIALIAIFIIVKYKNYKLKKTLKDYIYTDNKQQINDIYDYLYNVNNKDGKKLIDDHLIKYKRHNKEDLLKNHTTIYNKNKENTYNTSNNSYYSIFQGDNNPNNNYDDVNVNSDIYDNIEDNDNTITNSYNPYSDVSVNRDENLLVKTTFGDDNKLYNQYFSIRKNLVTSHPYILNLIIETFDKHYLKFN